MLELNLYSDWLKGKDIIKYPVEILKNYKFSSRTVSLLSKIGVPYKIEPSIWFLSCDKGGLKKLADYYVEISNPVKQKSIIEKKEILNKLIVIAKSIGNAICLNENNQLVWIDYDDYNELFINNNFEEFLECIACFNKLVDHINQRKTGRMRYYNYITKDEILKLKEQLNNICNNRLNESDFWSIKLKFLEEHI